MSRAPMFGDVVDPSIHVGSRSWYTLPLSIALHALIAAVLVIVPLLATDVLPMPFHDRIAQWVDVHLPSLPPVPPSSQTPPRLPDALLSSRAAPLEAPSGIARETGLVVDEGTWLGLGSDVVGGVPEGIAFSTAEAAPPPPRAASPTAPQAPVRVGGRIQAPQKVKDARPVYPVIAQQAHVQGVVILEATIGTDGTVTDARILRSLPLLDQAALEAVRQWQFTPTLLNGAPVPIVMTVTVNFQLER